MKASHMPSASNAATAPRPSASSAIIEKAAAPWPTSATAPSGKTRRNGGRLAAGAWSRSRRYDVAIRSRSYMNADDTGEESPPAAARRQPDPAAPGAGALSSASEPRDEPLDRGGAVHERRVALARAAGLDGLVARGHRARVLQRIAAGAVARAQRPVLARRGRVRRARGRAALGHERPEVGRPDVERGQELAALVPPPPRRVGVPDGQERLGGAPEH